MNRPADKRVQKSKVNQSPRGLQSLLGNVNQGINPHELNHIVTPTADLSPFWAVDKLQIKSSLFISNGTAFQNTYIQVPEGEVWNIYGAGVGITKALGNEINASIRIFSPPWLSAGTNEFIFPVFDTQSAMSQSSGGITSCGGLFPQPLILPADWGIMAQLDGVNAPVAGTDIDLGVLYVPMKA